MGLARWTGARGAARRLTLALMLGTIVVAGRTTPAAAQRAADKAAAEQLFKEARALMTAQQFAEACPKLEASLKLDAALGTRLNLAACYEQVGKLASAWGMYHEAEDLAAQENQPRRVKFAQDHARALEPRLPRLTIVVPPAAQLPGLAVTRDGTVLDAALLGSSIYVDPGPRVIVATAPGYKPVTGQVVAQEGQDARFEVPVLEAEPPAPVPEPPAPRPEPSPVLGGPVEPAPPLRDPGRGRRRWGLVAAGAGVISAGVGLGFGLSARSKWDAAKGKCDLVTDLCTPQGQALAETARTRATISTVTVSAGAALVVAGAVLYVTAPRPERAPRVTTRLVPAASPDALGLALTGSF